MLKDDTAIRKKTDEPPAASTGGIDKDGNVSSTGDRGTKMPFSSSSATDTGASQRKGRGKSSLNADVVSPFCIYKFVMKKALRETQTLCAGCSKAEP